MKCTRQRCQEACSTLETAAFSPSCASEITSLTPRRPRRASERRNSVQKVSASETPIEIPSTSRRTSALTATATITATETMRPGFRHLCHQQGGQRVADTNDADQQVASAVKFGVLVNRLADRPVDRLELG